MFLRKRRAIEAATLSTDRFLLKKVNLLSLALRTRHWTQNSELYRYFGVQQEQLSFPGWYKFLQKFYKPHRICRAIVVKDTNEIIGISTVHVESGIAVGETSTMIGDPAWHRKGVQKEVLDACIEDCFTRLQCRKMRAIVASENTASEKNLRKLGYTREGVLRREFRTLDGGIVDRVAYGLLREEWEKRSAQAGTAAGATEIAP